MTVMKNCDPLVLGPALAMLTVNGLSCLRLGWNSSSNSWPHIDVPPVPVPLNMLEIDNRCSQRIRESFKNKYLSDRQFES